MSNAAPPRRNTRELDTIVSRGRQQIERLRAQIQQGKIDPGFFDQRLVTIQDALDRVMEDRKFASQDERLARLFTVSRLIGSSLDLQTCLDQVMDAIIQLTNAERGYLMLLDDSGNLVPRSQRNFDAETLDSSDATVSRSVTGKVVSSGQAIVTTNAQEDPRFSGQASIISNSLSSIMASPLRIRDKIIGVIYVDSRVLTGLFSEDDLHLLDLFGEQAAIAIDNAFKVQQREKAYQAQIDALRVEIDEAKTQRQVGEIVESAYFQRIKDQAQRIRERRQPG
ncbi:MAG TPA: GAF domain-containing protein [Aggregatilineales bacterium]|nr:GAF domain-containing protein [Aggregatilineales bacterium]